MSGGGGEAGEACGWEVIWVNGEMGGGYEWDAERRSAGLGREGTYMQHDDSPYNALLPHPQRAARVIEGRGKIQNIARAVEKPTPCQVSQVYFGMWCHAYLPPVGILLRTRLVGLASQSFVT